MSARITASLLGATLTLIGTAAMAVENIEASANSANPPAGAPHGAVQDGVRLVNLRPPG